MLHFPCIQIIHWRTKSRIWLGQQSLRRGFRATGNECHSAVQLQKRILWYLDVPGWYISLTCVMNLSSISLACLKPLSVCCWIIFQPQFFPNTVSEQYEQWRSSHRSCLKTLQGSAVHHPCKMMKLPVGQQLLALKVYNCPYDTWNSMYRKPVILPSWDYVIRPCSFLEEKSTPGK